MDIYFRYASHHAGVNGFTAPGASEIMTTSTDNDDARASGTFMSDENGQGLFTFRRTNDHIHLSAMSIANMCSRISYLATFHTIVLHRSMN